MNKDKKEIILNWLKNKEENKTLSLEEREVFASIKELLHTKKYGLVFEEKEEDIFNLTNESILTLTQKDSIISDKTKGLNYLIEGDNYQSLKLLLKTHRNRIDVIYIDPPYNTGNKDFVYNDQYVDSEDTFKHSKWLSFMKRRLQLAKELLSEEGVIFISIDDNEQAQLKLLCDEVFGEANFIGQFSWYKSATPANISNKIKKNIEYILCYEKNRNKIRYQSIIKFSSSNNGLMNQTNKVGVLKFPANYVDTSLSNGIYKKGKYGTKSYDIQLLEDTEVKNGFFTKEIILQGKFKWSQDYLDSQISNKTKISIKTIAFSPSYEKNTKEPDLPTNFISTEVGVDTTENAGRELQKIFGYRAFDYPKPISLIMYLSKFTNKKDAIILDFFAGSGTTGHAVAKLNVEDGGNRTYILCTNNENNICEDVTFKRLNNIQEELPHNLIYNKVDSINKEEFINSYYSNEYLKQLNDSCYQLAQLELGKLIDNEEILFATSQEEFNAFSQEQLLNAKVIFMAENNIDIYECAVYDKIKNKIVVIPDKYYSKELTEVGYLW
ncbi:site-specific DNA-methyltransferase [Mycoplasma sp. BRA285]